MANKVSDITKGIEAFFADKLTPLPVLIGYRDPRGAEEDRSFPRAGLYLYDMQVDRGRMIGQPRFYRQMQGDASMIESVKHPVPVNLFFQINLAAETQADLWDYSEQLSVLIGDHSSKVTLQSGEELFIIGETVTKTEPLEMVFRFRVQTFFDNLDDVTSVKGIITRHIDIMGETIQIESPPPA